jgi:hypothetical protein
MKLDDINFSALAKLVEKMDAPPVRWESGVIFMPLNPEIGRTPPIPDIEVPLSEVEFKDGRPTFEGRYVLLYIKDTNKAMDVVTADPASLQKFHFFDCRRLDEMRAANRFQKYIATQRQTGDFLLHVTEPYTRTLHQNVKARLPVCRYCLWAINYQDYRKSPQSRRDEIVENFNIAEFFQKYSYSFRSEPSRTAETAPPNRYPVDWEDIAHEHKSRVHWRCQECPVDLSEHRHLLHVHHINGVRTDNRTSNLRVLCVGCHSQQPQHQHLKSRFSRELIELREIRRWQGLVP